MRTSRPHTQASAQGKELFLYLGELDLAGVTVLEDRDGYIDCCEGGRQGAEGRCEGGAHNTRQNSALGERSDRQSVAVMERAAWGAPAALR